MQPLPQHCSHRTPDTLAFDSCRRCCCDREMAESSCECRRTNHTHEIKSAIIISIHFSSLLHYIDCSRFCVCVRVAHVCESRDPWVNISGCSISGISYVSDGSDNKLEPNKKPKEKSSIFFFSSILAFFGLFHLPGWKSHSMENQTQQ